jgi:hypothetical protein
LKYNQPFDQPSNPNAPYVDGNPNAGIQGSIVPAASIEFPQREIVAAIQAAGLVADNGDLTQLLKMIKIADVFNHFKFGVNQGSATQWSTAIPSLPIMPPPDGTAIWFKPGYPSTPAGAVFSVNGSAFAPVVHPDLSPITEGDIIPTGWVLLLYYQGNWQIANAGGASTRQTGSLPILTTNVNWYVNGTSGNDTTYDGTSATVTSAKVGPFKTIQRAASEVLKYNMNGYNQYIWVADGAYVGPVNFVTLNGSGSVYVIGNVANPQNCPITCPAAGSGGTPYDCAIYQSGGDYNYSGFRLSTPALDGIAITGGRAVAHDLRFGPCARYHIGTGYSGATLGLVQGTFTIEAGANAIAHIGTILAGLSTFPAQTPANWPALNILGPVTFSGAFIATVQLGIAQMKWTSITGAANVTGPKYSASGNGVVDSIGSGASYYPGSTAGVLATGGQYV